MVGIAISVRVNEFVIASMAFTKFTKKKNGAPLKNPRLHVKNRIYFGGIHFRSDIKECKKIRAKDIDTMQKCKRVV